MTNPATEIATLTGDVKAVLDRYNIPLDDKSFILDKIEQGIASLLDRQREAFTGTVETIRQEISGERDHVRGEVDGIRKSAISKLSEIEKKIEEAYREGVSEGMSQTAPSGMSPFQVLLGLSLLALAIVFVAGTLFKKAEKND